MGMYGVDAFTPIINPPNTAILGVAGSGATWTGTTTTGPCLGPC